MSKKKPGDYEAAVMALGDVAYSLETTEDPAQRHLALNLHMLHTDVIESEWDRRTGEIIQTAISADEFPVVRAVSLIGIIANDRNYLAEYDRILRSLPKIEGVSFSETPPKRPRGWQRKTAEWGKEFLTQFIQEFRKLVCENRGEYAELKSKYKDVPTSVAAAATTAAVASLGISEPMALGVATLTVLSIGSVTKNAFCKSTDEHILKAIDERISKGFYRDEQS